MRPLDDAAKGYAKQFPDREHGQRVVAFAAGAEWATSDDNPAMKYPDVLPPTNEIRCTYLTPCPTRPTRFIGRFATRPWRCPECSRWWVTEWRFEDNGHWVSRWMWVRAEEKTRKSNQ